MEKYIYIYIYIYIYVSNPLIKKKVHHNANINIHIGPILNLQNIDNLS